MSVPLPDSLHKASEGRGEEKAKNFNHRQQTQHMARDRLRRYPGLHCSHIPCYVCRSSEAAGLGRRLTALCMPKRVTNTKKPHPFIPECEWANLTLHVISSS